MIGEKNIAKNAQQIEASVKIAETIQSTLIILRNLILCHIIQGYTDCVNDPAYILYTDPKYYKEVFGDMTPTQALFVENGCMDSIKNDPDEKYYCYDDEDK